MPMANFRTEGRITTHLALFRTLCGMLSGASKISFSTLPAFSTRSCSFSCANAGKTRAKTRHTPINILFMIFPQRLPVRPKANPKVIVERWTCPDSHHTALQGYVLQKEGRDSDQFGKFILACKARKRELLRNGSNSGSTFRKTKPFERSAYALSSQSKASSFFPSPK